MVNIAPNCPPPRTPRTDPGSMTTVFTIYDSDGLDLSFRSPDPSLQENGARCPSVSDGIILRERQSLDNGPLEFAPQANRHFPLLRWPPSRREFPLASARWKGANQVREDSPSGSEPQ